MNENVKRHKICFEFLQCIDKLLYQNRTKIGVKIVVRKNYIWSVVHHVKKNNIQRLKKINNQLIFLN